MDLVSEGEGLLGLDVLEQAVVLLLLWLVCGTGTRCFYRLLLEFHAVAHLRPCIDGGEIGAWGDRITGAVGPFPFRAGTFCPTILACPRIGALAEGTVCACRRGL